MKIYEIKMLKNQKISLKIDIRASSIKSKIHFSIKNLTKTKKKLISTF